VIEPPQAAVAKKSTAKTIFSEVCGLICFISAPCRYRYCIPAN
jgi:hypothetical protein